MDIEKLKGDIFKEFGLKIDESDPLWAYIFINEKITTHFSKIIDDTLKSRDEKISEINSILSQIYNISVDIDNIVHNITKATDKVDVTIKDYKGVATQIETNLNTFSATIDKILKDIDLSKTEEIIKNKIEERVQQIPTEGLRVEVEKLNKLYNDLSDDREKFGELVTTKGKKINSAIEELKEVYKTNILIAGILGIVGASLFAGAISYWQSKIYFEENFNKKVDEKVKSLKSINEEIDKLLKSRTNFKLEVEPSKANN